MFNSSIGLFQTKYCALFLIEIVVILTNRLKVEITKRREIDKREREKEEMSNTSVNRS